MDRWRDYEEATIVAGGVFYPLKGMTQDATPRRMTAWLHQEGFPAAQLTSDYIVADGIHFPSKRRAYTRGPDRRPITEMLMVSIDISQVRFKRVQVPSKEETIALPSR